MFLEYLKASVNHIYIATININHILPVYYHAHTTPFMSCSSAGPEQVVEECAAQLQQLREKVPKELAEEACDSLSWWYKTNHLLDIHR